MCAQSRFKFVGEVDLPLPPTTARYEVEKSEFSHSHKNTHTQTQTHYLAANYLFGVSSDVPSLIMNFNIKSGRVSILYEDWVIFILHVKRMWIT